MANRMMGMVSAYALALLTSRVLLIDWKQHTAELSDLFDTPGFAWDVGALPAALITSDLKSRGRPHHVSFLPDVSYPGVP